MEEREIIFEQIMSEDSFLKVRKASYWSIRLRPKTSSTRVLSVDVGWNSLKMKLTARVV